MSTHVRVVVRDMKKTNTPENCKCHCHRNKCNFDGNRHMCMNQFSSCDHCNPKNKRTLEETLETVEKIQEKLEKQIPCCGHSCCCLKEEEE